MRTSRRLKQTKRKNVFSFFYEERFEVVPDRPVPTTAQPKRGEHDARGEIGVGNDLLRYQRLLRPRRLARLTLSPEFTA
jgi:hypothetical protein